jgi:uncharacterized protein (TIGR02453 family)
VRFAGFPEQALIFYEGLEADNSKPYWTDHKAEYDSCVRAPLEALLAELEPEFGAGKLYRPYRDVRFSKDKTPYKTAAGAVAEPAGGAGILYVQLSAAGLRAAGGIYHAESDQVARLRRAVADDVPGGELERALAALRRAGYQVDGERLTRLPRGYPADHPRGELLRHKSLYAGRFWPPEPWLHERAALTRVRTAWRAFGPLNSWLAGNVGASAGARS